MLSGFVKKAFSGFFEVILWLILVGCVIGGGTFGYGNRIVGGLLGLVGGFLLIIIGGGFIATILNIDENLEDIRSKMYSTSGSNLSNLSPIGAIKEERKCKKCGKSFDSGYSGCPHCGSSEFE